MIENFLWAVFGILSALIGVLIVYIKNSQKILHLTSNEHKINPKKNEIIKK
jgi:hypothetical protein